MLRNVMLSVWMVALLPVSLACLGGRDGDERDDPDTEDVGRDDVSDNDSESSTSGPPVFLEFSVSRMGLSEGDTVRFTAVLTDPDGIDDLIGGSLRNENDVAYGAFRSAADEGAYEITVSWSEMHALDAIWMSQTGVADSGHSEWAENRTFVATFYDESGNQSTRSVELTLECEDPQRAVCDDDAGCEFMAGGSYCLDCDFSCDENEPDSPHPFDLSQMDCSPQLDGCVYDIGARRNEISGTGTPPTCEDVCVDTTCLSAQSDGEPIACDAPPFPSGDRYESLWCECLAHRGASTRESEQ